MSEKRASKKKSAESFHSVAQIARRPSTDRRMDQREDFEAAVNRAVAAALQARGLGASPAASSSACAAAASPPKVLVTSRDLPEGLAMNFLSNHGVRLVCCTYHLVSFLVLTYHK